MPQKCVFTNGSFVLHKLRIEDSPCKFSAWFTKEGELKDAARYDAQHRELEATQAQFEELKRLGRIYA